ncbi:hypothetical protein LEP1GSC137_3538 [Leptospira borgpetersenii str. Noumea 25]|uniref:Uncharacterized protein n=1 Tax=Leptospira borgpetersenii serovar Ballum TaxID=280505 RepID=A0A0S2ITG1_LEPBO|nr:hypothetical protein LBBP_02349 [Leptospira borgpetersenii serovar Ballum]EMO08082.1 hypothetical protein LEP1GSC137_3538 [Leptospira borgpetersenii str. Noumea 25]
MHRSLWVLLQVALQDFGQVLRKILQIQECVHSPLKIQKRFF